MPESAAPPPDLFAASAPTRDFLRPARSSGQRHTLPLPDAPPPAPALWIAALAVLLRAHARTEAVALTLRRGGRLQALALDVAAALPFTHLVGQAERALQAIDAGERPPTSAETRHEACPGAAAPPGVLVDFAAPGSPPLAADLVLRCADATLDADADLYRADSLPPLARQLAHVLATADAATPAAIGDLPLCDAAERTRVLRGFNRLRLPLPAQATFATLIDAQVARCAPRANCAAHGSARLSWAELDLRSRALAQELIACGVGPGAFVAVLDRRGLDFVVAMVAVWRAGGAYVPVDPGYPAERVKYMLADSEAAVAVVGAQALERFAPALRDCPALRHVICQQPLGHSPQPGPWTVHGPDARAAQAGVRAASPAGPRDPAYMLYTSGSTGRPKGAIVRHDGAVNHLLAQAQALGRETVGRFLQSAPASSDISVWQFAAPLALGGTTVIVDDATDVARVLAEVRQHGLHLIELVPTVFRYLIDYAAALPPEERALPSLRYAMVTGEAASVELVNAWLALYPQIPVVNAYGPTEAADDVCQAVIRAPLPPRQLSVPIGQPLANLDLHVLDAALRPLPVGAWGEICIAGVGVGAGYWQQPERTAEAFVGNPFADHPDAAGPVLYRSGDIGRWRDDGSLECAGRVDHQVQLRGQRIELPEIEAVLRQHPGVADAVARVFRDGDGGGDGGGDGRPGSRRAHDPGRLVAFVVPAAGAAADEAAWCAQLSAHLAARLPAAMLPSLFVPLAALPLNPAGKVDRNALRLPASMPGHADRGRPGSGSDAAARRSPRSAAEQALARLWAQELGVAEVGIDDDFFALGGDSMSALAIAVGARAAGWLLRSADLLAHPTIAALAAVAQPVMPPAPPAPAEAVADTFRALRPLDPALRARFLGAHPQWSDVQPLTPSQQGLFVHWLLARDKRVYVDQLGYELDGELDARAFIAAWQAVVDRHPALRAGFLRSALSQPVQVTARSAPLPWTVLDLSALEDGAQADAWQAHCARAVDDGFDLAAPPLMRLTLARLGPRRHALAWTHHHLLLDGWSIAGVLREVLALHAAGGDAVRACLPAVIDDTLYREHLAAVDLRAGLRHWQQTLAGVAGAAPLPGAGTVAAAPGFGELDLELPPASTAALAATAARCGVTLGTLLQAAWALLVARHTGCDEVVLGVVSSGRELPVPGIERMLGLFVVTQPLRVETASGPPLAAWLAALQAQAAAGRAHEALPLAAAVRAAALPPGRPLFETLFVLWNFPTLRQDEGGAAPAPLSIRPTHYRTVPAYPLSLVAVPGPALQLRLVHDRQRLGDADALVLRATLQRLLAALARGEDPRSGRTRETGHGGTSPCAPQPPRA